jgi:hypothetical protein
MVILSQPEYSVDNDLLRPQHFQQLILSHDFPFSHVNSLLLYYSPL